MEKNMENQMEATTLYRDCIGHRAILGFSGLIHQ